MSEIITITSIAEKESANKRPYKLVKNAADQGWFVFDTKLWPLLVTNATVEVETEIGTDGKSKRIVGVTRTLPTPNGTTAASAHTDQPTKDELIMRQVALKAAVDSIQGTDAVTATDVLRTANIYLAWLRNPEGADDTPF